MLNLNSLEINDPWLPELVRCVDAGETIIDNFFILKRRKDRSLTDLICHAGDEPSAALLSTLETPPTQKPSQTPRNTMPSPAAAN